MARILVTGGAGFIGSHFVRYWRRAHPADRVTNLDRITYAGGAGAARDPQVRFVKGDIGDARLVARLVKGTDAVFHFAAETHVDRSILDSQIFLKTNVLGTQNLLELSRRAGVKRFVYVSTDEVYGSIPRGEFTERSPLAPNSPYAASKASGDLLSRAYWATYGFPVLTTRCCNNYGSHQFPEKVIPLFVTNLIEGKPLPVYGKGANVREWIHAEDHCRGIDVAYRRGKLGEAYNIGTGEEISNIELARKLLKIFGRPDSFLQFVKDRPGHDLRYALDSSKIRKLGWKPKFRFEEGLRQTAEWYRENAGWWRAIKGRAEYRAYLSKQYQKR